MTTAQEIADDNEMSAGPITNGELYRTLTRIERTIKEENDTYRAGIDKRIDTVEEDVSDLRGALRKNTYILATVVGFINAATLFVSHYSSKGN